MGVYLRAASSFGLMIMVFLAAGNLFQMAAGSRKGFASTLVQGYFVYFAVFNLIEIPCAFLYLPLHTLSYIMAGLSLLTVVTALAMNRKKIKYAGSYVIGEIKEHGWILILAAGLVVLQCLAVAYYWDTTVDATFYIGETSTSVYTDTMFQFDPYTGERMKAFPAKYFFSAFPIHNAVMCKLTGLHPIVQGKVVMNIINNLMADAVVYLAGLQLFSNNKKKADTMLIFFLILCGYTFTLHSAGNFLLTRGYEGKAVITGVVMPMIFYLALCYWKEAGRNQVTKGFWVFLLSVSIAAICFSGSALLVAMGIGAGIFVSIIRSRRWKDIVPLLLCILPQMIYLVIYYADKYDIVQLTIA